MEKTDNFFLISSYNCNPQYLLDYCQNYIIYDRSDIKDYENEIAKLGNVYRVENTGHSITDYFKFFAEHYNKLPDNIELLKANIIGRHVSKDFFERVYNNKYYTFLYEDNEKKKKSKKNIFFQTSENEFLEINNSWYVPYHPHRFFKSYNQLLKFIYQDPILPEYCLFAPGACYIISKHQILKNTKEFYLNLNKIISYTLKPKFPSEAHQVERMLHTIFTCNYNVNDYMNDTDKFDIALQDHLERNMEEIEFGFLNKLKNFLRNN